MLEIVQKEGLFDVLRTTGVTLEEAKLYGFDIEAESVRREVETLQRMGIEEGDRFVLSMPPNMVSFRKTVSVYNELRSVEWTIDVKDKEIYTLADIENSCTRPQLRLLKAAQDWKIRKWEGGSAVNPLGHYPGICRNDQVCALSRDANLFALQHADFELREASVQEVMSAIIRGIIDLGARRGAFGEIQILTSGYHVPGEANRNILINVDGGQITVSIDKNRNSSGYAMMAVSAGEAI